MQTSTTYQEGQLMNERFSVVTRKGQITIPADFRKALGLKEGDKVYLEDAKGREYTYQVFRKLVVEPANLSVLRPIKGKNIVSLQTCTLPDYTNRVIYRAVLKDVKS